MIRRILSELHKLKRYVEYIFSKFFLIKLFSFNFSHTVHVLVTSWGTYTGLTKIEFYFCQQKSISDSEKPLSDTEKGECFFSMKTEIK